VIGGRKQAPERVQQPDLDALSFGRRQILVLRTGDELSKDAGRAYP
jgi:hypothetical protein